MHFRLIAPGSLELPPELVELLREREHEVTLWQSPAEALQQADVIYTTRIQKERFVDEKMEAYPQEFQINAALVNSVCKKDCIIMHPLPRDARAGANDLATDLNHDPRLAIFRQTDNGIPVRMAIFAVLLGVEQLVFRDLKPASWRGPERVGPDDAAFYGIS